MKYNQKKKKEDNNLPISSLNPYKNNFNVSKKTNLFEIRDGDEMSKRLRQSKKKILCKETKRIHVGYIYIDISL